VLGIFKSVRNSLSDKSYIQCQLQNIDTQGVQELFFVKSLKNENSWNFLQ